LYAIAAQGMLKLFHVAQDFEYSSSLSRSRDRAPR
jgi:hypothetical protein